MGHTACVDSNTLTFDSDMPLLMDSNSDLSRSARDRCVSAVFWRRAVDMRDNHSGYPEIVNAYERDGLYFGVVMVVLPDDAPTLEFGVCVFGYRALKKSWDTDPSARCREFRTDISLPVHIRWRRNLGKTYLSSLSELNRLLRPRTSNSAVQKRCLLIFSGFLS